MTEYEKELETERTMKDQFMAHHRESPFVAGRVYGFDGLRYFPIDPKFRVTAKLLRQPTPQEAYLRTNRDGQAVMRYLGDLAFSVGSESLRLRVYHAGEGVGTSVFVPFRDRTSGKESYASGRYLTLDLTEDDVYELDFNRAFNPYCAYTPTFECPFPPIENDLPVAIRAGEKAWLPKVEVRAAVRPKSAPPKKVASRRRPAARKRPATKRRR